MIESFIAQMNLFYKHCRENLIFLCIVLSGAKAMKSYLASFQGEKCVVYKTFNRRKT